MSKKKFYVENKVIEYRKSQGLTQRQLANMLDVTPQYISYIERNSTVPSLTMALKISKVLKVPIYDLFFLKD